MRPATTTDCRLLAALATACLFTPILTGCADSGAGGWGGSIDTLASGAVVVSNPVEGMWTGADRWIVEEDLRIGSAMSEGPELFGRLTGLIVTHDGAIHLLDRQAKELKRFGADGAHEWTAGREGAGPGEFRDPIGLTLGPNGRLWITDARNARYATYGPTGEPGPDYVRKVGGYALPWRGGFDTEGRFHEQTVAVSSGGARHGVVRMDSLFEPADTFLFPEHDGEQFVHTSERGSIGASVPFTPSQQKQWDPRGYLWVAVNDEYAITQLTMEGDTLMVIRKPPGERIPVTSEEKEEAVENLEWFTRQGGRVDPGRIPSEKPAFTSFTVAPDGHVWVRLTPRQDEEGYRHDVFDPEGRYLGEVRLPSALYYAAFGDHTIHTIGQDSLGVQTVVRWRIRRGAAEGGG